MPLPEYKKLETTGDIRLDSENRNHKRKHAFLDYSFLLIKVSIAVFLFIGLTGWIYSFFRNEEMFFEILFSVGSFLGGLIIGILGAQQILKQ